MKKLFRALLLIFLIAFISSFVINLIKAKGSMESSIKTNNTADYNDILVLVNKENSLPEEYNPDDLVKLTIKAVPSVTNEEMMMRKEAAKALEDLVKNAKSEGIDLYCVSGYRSYSTQNKIYLDRIKTQGQKEADKYVAYPGQSEHQTGLAVDISDQTAVNESQAVDFSKTKEGIWLKNNVQNFGFIIRYPAGKEDITGYNYEPWHVRFVGVKAAKEIKSKDIVLEEYLN